MRRHLPNLHMQVQSEKLLEGLFLARVDRAGYNSHPHKPFLAITFSIVEPRSLSSYKISGRIYCTPRALWKVNWFLRDFGYDTDLLGRDEIDERALTGLVGIVRTSRRTWGQRIFLNLEAFAPSSDWESAVGVEKQKCGEIL
jgi:hypothetical protein